MLRVPIRPMGFGQTCPLICRACSYAIALISGPLKAPAPSRPKVGAIPAALAKSWILSRGLQNDNATEFGRVPPPVRGNPLTALNNP